MSVKWGGSEASGRLTVYLMFVPVPLLAALLFVR